MKLLKSHPLNKKVIRYLNSLCDVDVPALAVPDSHPDPYWKLGCRPDEVMVVWDYLGSQLPTDCRAIVYGKPALVHPTAGVVLALAFGTTYLLRVPQKLVDTAIEAGCRTTQKGSNGVTTNIEQELGRGWVFGNSNQVGEWLLEMYKELEDST